MIEASPQDANFRMPMFEKYSISTILTDVVMFRSQADSHDQQRSHSYGP